MLKRAIAQGGQPKDTPYNKRSDAIHPVLSANVNVPSSLRRIATPTTIDTQQTTVDTGPSADNQNTLNMTNITQSAKK